MRAITESEIRASFVNCSKGEAKRLGLPRDFADRPWDDLDFLGWQDPGAPGRAYLVVERDGRPVGISLRVTSGGVPRLHVPQHVLAVPDHAHQRRGGPDDGPPHR